MDQDGSGENPVQDDTIATTRNLGAPLQGPRAMLLTLIDSSGNPVRSEMAPFAPSYEVALQMSLQAFHEDFGDRMEGSRMVLKYHTKRSNGIFTWAGLAMTVGSEDTWRQVLSSSDENPEIGVFIFSEISQALPSHPQGLALIMRFCIGTREAYRYSGVEVPCLPTYPECLRKACEVFEREGCPGLVHRNPAVIPISEVVQLRIYNHPTRRFVTLDPLAYDSAIQKYTFHGDGKWKVAILVGPSP